MKVKVITYIIAFFQYGLFYIGDIHDPSINLEYGNSFRLQQPFSNDGPVINNQWMLRVWPPGICNVTYTAISNNRTPEQTISIDNCRTIHACWLVFESEAVCLYDHMTSGIPLEPNEQLYLALMMVQEGNWTLLPYPISVFTPGQYVGTATSVGLYETIDDEYESKAAVFLIGKGIFFYRVKLFFQPAPVERRFTKVCDQDHRVICISVSENNVLAVCDNKVQWMMVGQWKRIDVTPPELTGVTFTETSVDCYISNNSTGLITRNTAGNTEYCFIGQPSQDTLSQCGVIPNASLSHGLFINDTHFLALLDGDIDVGVVSTLTNDSYKIIGVDFCHQDDCWLVLTKNRIYIGNEQKTMVLDRETLGVISVRNVSVYEMLPMTERQLVPSPTSTAALTSTTTSNSSAITQTTTSPVNISSTSAPKSTITSTSMTGDISPGITGLTNTSTINMHTSISAVKSINVTITNDPTTATIFEPSKTSMVESPTAVDHANSNSTANNSTKSEFGALSIIIGVSTVLSLLILILLLIIAIIMCATKCCKTKLRHLEVDHQERIETRWTQGEKLSETGTVQSESDDGKPGGEVVMTQTNIEMYELPSANTSTITSTNNSNNMTKQKVLFKNNVY